MEVVFLGTGTGAPSAKRGAPSLLIRAGGFNILVDAGSGTLRQLARMGLSHNQLDFVFFTHFHPDHVGDLAPYLFAVRYWPEPARTSPTRVFGPEGFLTLCSHLRRAFGRWVDPPEDRLVLAELPLGTRHVVDLPGVRVESGPIPHNPESLGYRLSEAGGPVLAVTGDSDFGPELVDLARGAQVLITECSFPEGRKRYGHLTPRLAGRAAREAGVATLALTHFYPETENSDLLAPLGEEFGGEIILADDFLLLGGSRFAARMESSSS
ncbi:MAG: MBL fold metallo-hydrolase [Pseudomonadota bacterium]